MQQILTGLNLWDGPDFVSVYLDDILVFSPSLEDHLTHLGQILNRLSEVGLKLKLSKCHFVIQQVEHLGHLIAPQGILHSPVLACLLDICELDALYYHTHSTFVVWC